MEKTKEIVNYMSELMETARAAQKVAEGYSQEKVDEIVAAIGYEMSTNEEIIAELAQMALEESKLGDLESKKAKLRGKGRQMWYGLKNEKSMGVVEEIPEKGLVRIAKPVGVIGSLVPSTQPEQHPMIQAMYSIKARNAIIFSPHPGAKKSTNRTVEILRSIVKKYDGEEDLLICIEEPSIDKTNELMKQVDLVIATGGAGMVKAAYSSGTPAYGVGAGNANIIINEDANLQDAAEKIKASKTFDLAAGCSCDNALVIHQAVYTDMLEELEKVGGKLLSEDEKARLRTTIWPEWPENTRLNRDIVAKPLATIAELADIEVDENDAFFLVEENGAGIDHPFSGEKMSLTIAIYKANDIDDAIGIVNSNMEYSGAGHSCGIYSKDQSVIDKVAAETYTTRVVVNQAQALTNTGGWTNGMPFTSTLGCGTWGGNIASENIALKHYLNNTWVIKEIPNYQPSDEELFAGFTPRA